MKEGRDYNNMTIDYIMVLTVTYGLNGMVND